MRVKKIESWTAQNLAAALGLEDPEKYTEKLSTFCREYGLSPRRTGKSFRGMLKACAYFLNGETVAYYVPTMRAVEPVYNTIRGWLETLHVTYITPRKHLLTHGTGSFTFGSDLQLEKSLTCGTDTHAKVFQDYWVSVPNAHLCRVLAHSKICASCNKRLRGKELQDARHRRWLIKTYPWEAKTLDAVRRGNTYAIYQAVTLDCNAGW